MKSLKNMKLAQLTSSIVNPYECHVLTICQIQIISGTKCWCSQKKNFPNLWLSSPLRYGHRGDGKTFLFPKRFLCWFSHEKIHPSPSEMYHPLSLSTKYHHSSCIVPGKGRNSYNIQTHMSKTIYFTFLSMLVKWMVNLFGLAHIMKGCFKRQIKSIKPWLKSYLFDHNSNNAH